LAVLVPVCVATVLILPSEIYAGVFPYVPAPIQRAAGIAALRASCANAEAGWTQSIALGYLEFSGKAAEYGKLSELVPDDVQQLCLGPEEREEPMTPVMYGAMLMRGNDQEARRAIQSTGHPAGFCRDGHDYFPQNTQRRIVSICRSLGLPARHQGH
jgi:hypothetical protein